MLHTWPDEFIPPEIENNVTHISDSDHHEREGYTVHLQRGNDENDLAAAQSITIQDADPDLQVDETFLTGSVMTDVNGERSQGDLRSLNALLDLVTINSRHTADGDDVAGREDDVCRPGLDEGIDNDESNVIDWNNAVDDDESSVDHESCVVDDDSSDVVDDDTDDDRNNVVDSNRNNIVDGDGCNVVDDRNYVKATTESMKNAEPVITYAIRGQARLLSAWVDNHYFTGAFPTLFPHGIGGHLDERNIKVSLEAFAKWALNHHSRRCDFLSLPGTFR